MFVTSPAGSIPIPRQETGVGGWSPFRCPSGRLGRLASLAVSFSLLSGCGDALDALEGTRAANQATFGYLHVEIADDLVTIVARDVTVHELLTQLARKSGLEVMIEDPLNEFITMELYALPLAAALDRVLQNHDYTWQQPEPLSLAGGSNDTNAGTLWLISDDPAGVHEAEPSLPSGVIAGDDQSTRRQVVFALADDGSDEAAGALVQAMTDPDPEIREEVVTALGEFGGTDVISALSQALQDPEIAVREAAIESFVDIGGEESAFALAVGLRDPEASLREDTVYALSQIGSDIAVALMEQALSDQDSAVREAAAQLLAEVSDAEK